MAGLLSKLFGTGIEEAGNGIKSVLEGVTDSAEKVKTLITGKISADKEAEIMLQITTLVSQVDNAQNIINLEEAKSESLFKSGWRPALGWTCIIAIFCYYIPPILLSTILWIFYSLKAGSLLARPSMDISELLILLGNLLGMGVLRQIDKGLRR
ncbi:MAG: 3TM-type holin [Deltaproteobacteria bacterium]|nr:3TM-type holin [Deltaproteobacteria bacterium]